jgi:glycyl-tRNA synthetase beta chain
METHGHRFLSKASFNVRHFADYQHELRNFNVILDAAERKKIIAEGLATEAAKAGLAVKQDDALLDEVTGLVEWPVVLMGKIEPEFMELPPEVLTTSMRTHQKYFACLDSKGALAPRFLLVANMMAEDGGRAIVAGNERVLRARLSDAKFFWDQDRKVKLERRVPKLAERVFYEGLGTMAQKVDRVRLLARFIAEFVGKELLPEARAELPNLADRAGLLAKADLPTAMVGEFPELQGIMGSYYAENDHEPLSVVQAIREHYSPQGPSDRCPNAEVSMCVALADKIDTLVGFFKIGERPTGSKDPYALRRAALGVIRIALENRIRISLRTVIEVSARTFPEGDGTQGPPGLPPAVVIPVLSFFADRLKVALRDQGVRHDLIAAIFALGNEDDLVRLLARVEALGAFLKTEDGANLLVAYRRAANILRIEEKKDGKTYSDPPDRELLRQAEEVMLAARLADATAQSAAALEKEDFGRAMAALAALRAPVDEFFNKVTVNVAGNSEGDRALRANRLRLLSQIRDTLNRVADFSQIEG